ncbi:MAG: MBL fold metallo-hydrolase [Patescibacteria group bacterium]
MSRKIKIFLIIFICVLMAVFCLFYYKYDNNKSEVIFFDVGQGDSALINLPGNNEILIDGGPDKTVLYKLNKYLPVYNRSIELMILTHPHSDHYTGLISVIDHYKVKKIIMTELKENSTAYDVFLEKIMEKNIEIKKPKDIEEIKLTDNIFLDVIYPWESLQGADFDKANDSSIVVKLNTPVKNFLFTGDIEAVAENEILENIEEERLKAVVLKVPHHGSGTSSNQDFVNAVSPEVAVISVGEDNKFGHPNLRVVRRLERAGAEVFRTDLYGDVVFKF